ncbi:MAG: SPOR domain-containing protein, partial [Bacteroidales bacterium]
RVPVERFKDLDPVYEFKGKDGYYRYTHGDYPNQEAAQAKLQSVKRKGYNQAFVKTVGSIKKL